MTSAQLLAVTQANKILEAAGLPTYTALLVSARTKPPAFRYVDADSLPAMLRRQAT